MANYAAACAWSWQTFSGQRRRPRTRPRRADREMRHFRWLLVLAISAWGVIMRWMLSLLVGP
jgi:hypothetical protein